jgi:hypothetical protein
MKSSKQKRTCKKCRQMYSASAFTTRTGFTCRWCAEQVELQKAYTDWSAAFAAADKAWKDAYEADKVRDAAAKRVSNLNATIRARGSK